MIEYSWLIPLPPLLLFPIILLIGKRTKDEGAWLSFGGALISLIISIMAAVDVLAGATWEITYTWINLKVITLDVGILMDPLAAVMVLVVSSIATLVNIYSLGYMAGEEGLPRYYAEISLFTGSMLILVLANSILLLFIGWELVGLCSYLLIGFWYKRPAAASAAKKAFIVTRFGDALMLAGIGLLFTFFGTLNISYINEHISTSNLDMFWLTVIGVLLFFGAVGKSAQIPLQGWLWDAMQGPTTVSCLIHSATMVKAGIYLVARLYPVFAASHYTMTFIAYTGGVTAFVAGTMALAEWDIKRILAYSTISQLGYMTLGLGVGAFSAAIIHLVSHASFKALLFLGAGSVIHVVHSNDLRDMGGLFKHMKITAITMLIASLSLSGIPPFSGYFSKDFIIEATYHLGDSFLYHLSVITAGITAFYILRLWYLAFILPPSKPHDHAHESPPSMTIPLVLLAIATTVLGVLRFTMPEFVIESVKGYGVTFTHEGLLVHSPLVVVPYLSAVPSIPEFATLFYPISLALTGLAIATAVYKMNLIPADLLTKNKLGSVIYKVLACQYGTDALYLLISETIIYKGISRAIAWFDLHVIDGIVNGIGKAAVLIATGTNLTDLYIIDGIINGIGHAAVRTGRVLRRIQTGIVQNYVSLMLIGLIIVLLVLQFQTELLNLLTYLGLI